MQAKNQLEEQETEVSVATGSSAPVTSATAAPSSSSGPGETKNAAGGSYTWKAFAPDNENSGKRGKFVKAAEGQDEDEGCNEGSLQFVIINEPMQPPGSSYRKAVRKHVKRNYHKERRKKEISPARKRKLV
jgi:hypothetical protein